MQISYIYHSFAFGEMIMASYGAQLVLCDWRYRKSAEAIKQRIARELDSTYIEATSPIIENTIQQLNEYFEQKRSQFDLPILLIGTDFQKKVWQSLSEIPYGKSISYLALSQQLGNEKAIRAVATANGANALAIIIPCHRVIGADGSLVGYAGGLATKKKLLALENSDWDKQLSLTF